MNGQSGSRHGRRRWPLLMLAFSFGAGAAQAAEEQRGQDAPVKNAAETPRPPEARVLAAGQEGGMQLGTTPSRLVLSPAAGENIASGNGRLVLRLDGLQADTPGGLTYELYLNLPPDARPDPEGPHYVGTLAFFGRTPGLGQPGAGTSQVYDVTAVVHGLAARGLWKEGQAPSVTFVPRGLESARTGKPLPVETGKKEAGKKEAGKKARVGRVALVRG